ncbi:MAG: sigma-70 family RNA polymerase sigma factor [Planctomycetes bacterium]|nr:sigma-70 family RNA polymerase sigma factor [Planctomycetota bacterium]MCB9868559.1 sigma-70 family RNA polymerase sigma factor [Planctomycetota bacterium]
MTDPHSNNAPSSSPGQLTRFLNELGHGGNADATEMMGIVLTELRRIAEASASSERPGRTLHPTALVNEAFVRLFDGPRVEWVGRKHFYAVAAKAMRHLLVDQARRRKRNPSAGAPEILGEPIADAGESDVELIDLDAALEELTALDPRQGRVVELKYFGGLEVAEVARVLDVSKTTVEREWRVARAWLARRLRDGGSVGPEA